MRLLAIILCALLTTLGCGPTDQNGLSNPTCGRCITVDCDDSPGATYSVWDVCEDQTSHPGLCNTPRTEFGVDCIQPGDCRPDRCF